MGEEPEIVEKTADYSVVFKPAKTHCAPIAHRDGSTLVEWFETNGNADTNLHDSGLMHRLDYDTHGLVLFAKNQNSFKFFKELQDKGEFIKEYSAVCYPTENNEIVEGFPPPPASFAPPSIIMSYFRPYGPGRKLVRPVTEIKKYHETAKDNGGFYRTEITDYKRGEKKSVFTVRIRRGFRHQIRCHLCWVGFPILFDPLYGRADTNPQEPLALRAHALFFTDPSSGKKRECGIEPFVL